MTGSLPPRTSTRSAANGRLMARQALALPPRPASKLGSATHEALHACMPTEDNRGTMLRGLPLPCADQEVAEAAA